MMQSFLIFTLCLAGTYCAIFTERTVVTDIERAQGFSCKSSDPNLGLMRAGEQRANYVANFCGEATCRNGGDVIKVTCGVVEGPPKCKIVGDMFRTYPECCPRVVC